MDYTQKILSIENLSASITKAGEVVRLLENLCFELHQGETIALIGASGSGKSLTSLAIMGLLADNIKCSGSIKYKNLELLSIGRKQWEQLRGKEIAMVFQEPMSALNPLMSCGEQLLEVILQHQKLSRSQGLAIALQWLDNVQIDDSRAAFYKYPHELSGGQKQRIMIAMAMCNEPKLLIADEPTTALDVLVQKDIILLMKQLTKASNTALIFITHDIALAKHIADRFIILDKGKVIDNQSLLNNRIDYVSRISGNAIQDSILKLEQVNVVYGSKLKTFHAVKDFSFEFKKGKTTGIVGGSGSGKSTITKALLGLVPITSGSIVMDGKSFDGLSNKHRQLLSKDIQMIFQDPYASLNPRLTVWQMLAEVCKVHQVVTNAQRREYIINLLEQVGIDAAALDKYPHEFSGGQRQRLCIARALAVQPRILILDESVAALDIFMQQQVVNLLRALQQRLGLTYIFISHDMHIIQQISDEVIVMHKGEIVEYGSATDIMNNPKHSYTQSLINAIP